MQEVKQQTDDKQPSWLMMSYYGVELGNGSNRRSLRGAPASRWKDSIIARWQGGWSKSRSDLEEDGGGEAKRVGADREES